MKMNIFNFPSMIFFTIDIMFEYAVRNLIEQFNKNLTCSFEDENKLVKYNCILIPEEKRDIKKITLNFDFNFSSPYDLSNKSFCRI